MHREHGGLRKYDRRSHRRHCGEDARRIGLRRLFRRIAFDVGLCDQGAAGWIEHEVDRAVLRTQTNAEKVLAGLRWRKHETGRQQCAQNHRQQRERCKRLGDPSLALSQLS